MRYDRVYESLLCAADHLTRMEENGERCADNESVNSRPCRFGLESYEPSFLCLLLFATQTEFARRGGNEKGRKNRIMSLFYGVINKIIIGESDTNCVNKLRQKKSFEMFNRFRDIVSLFVSIRCSLVYENSPLCVNWCAILVKVIQFKYHPFFWSFDISITA